jgi:hypothetical protein
MENSCYLKNTTYLILPGDQTQMAKLMLSDKQLQEESFILKENIPSRSKRRTYYFEKKGETVVLCS